MKLNYSAVMLISALLTGCAHPIIIAPDEQKISSNVSSNNNREYAVGYYISPKDKALEVTTLGGGGDNIRYYPYRDIDKGYKAMLSNVFVSVTKLDSIDKSDVQLQDKIDLILTPKIITTSGSTGFFTWPPTNFSVDLTNTITSVDGKIISEPRAVGTGGASTNEKLSEHGIAGRRAIEDALLKSQVMLFNVELPQKNKLNKSTGSAKYARKNSSDASISDRLKSLKELKDLGLIDEDEFKIKKKEIIKSL